MSAAEAKALVRAARVATLATVGSDGSPLATLVAVSADAEGRPVFLLSSLAEHTRNLRADARASVLISGAESSSLDRPRVSLGGRVTWLTGDDAEAAKQRFVSTHEEAKVWVALKDFQPARLELDSIRFVGGFARAQSVPLDDYRAQR